MTGSVTLLYVEPGVRVAAGEAVLAIEAMKMMTDVCAPCAGTVTEILCTLGQLVTEGDTVAEIAEE